MSPLVLSFSTLLFCLIYGAAYGAALNSSNDRVVFINRRSALVAVGFALLLFLLNKPFG